MVKDAYCSYEVSKLLKEKGFDESIFEFYVGNKETVRYARNKDGFKLSELPDGFYPHITHQMAVAWLMEKGIYICPRHRCFCGVKPKDTPYYRWQTAIFRLPGNRLVYPLPIDMAESYDSYEEAVEDGLKYTLVDFEKLLGL